MAACLRTKTSRKQLSRNNQSCPESDPEELELEPGTMAHTFNSSRGKWSGSCLESGQSCSRTILSQQDPQHSRGKQISMARTTQRSHLKRTESFPNHFNKANAHACLASPGVGSLSPQFTYIQAFMTSEFSSQKYIPKIQFYSIFPPSFLHWCYFKYKFKNMTYQIFSKMDRPAHENQATSNLLRPEMVWVQRWKA